MAHGRWLSAILRLRPSAGNPMGLHGSRIRREGSFAERILPGQGHEGLREERRDDLLQVQGARRRQVRPTVLIELRELVEEGRAMTILARASNRTANTVYIASRPSE